MEGSSAARPAAPTTATTVAFASTGAVGSAPAETEPGTFRKRG